MTIAKQIMICAATVAALIIPSIVEAALYAPTVLGDGAKLYYRLDEPSGTTAFDSATGDGTQNGLYAGVTLNQTGALTGDNPSDAAAKFDPTVFPNYSRIDSTFVLNPTSAFTVEFWLKPTSLTPGLDQTVLSQRNGTGFGRSLVYWNSTSLKLSSFLGGADRFVSTDPLTVGQYTYVAFVYDGAGNYAWYANGAADGAGSGVVPEAADGAIYVGVDKSGLGSSLRGTLDEFAIYTTALSGSQIAAHFVAASVPEPSALLLLGFGALVLWRRR